jgi:hypothetical protein
VEYWRYSQGNFHEFGAEKSKCITQKYFQKKKMGRFISSWERKRNPVAQEEEEKDPISGKAITLSIYDWNSANIIEIVRKRERAERPLKLLANQETIKLQLRQLSPTWSTRKPPQKEEKIIENQVPQRS